MRIRLLPDQADLGKMPYAFLLYTAFLFVDPLLRRSSGSWTLALGSLAAFLPLYFRNFWVQGREAVAISSAIALLGAIVLPHNWGGSVYFIFSAAFFAFAARPRRAAAAVLALVAVVILETIVFDLPFWAWMPAVTGCLAIGLANIQHAENYRRDAALRLAREDVEEMAKVAERERIARDLHDLLGHTLSVIVMKSELASKLAERDPPRAIQEIRDVEHVSREALSAVRRAVEGYRRHGLAGELRNAATALDAAGVRLIADLAPLTLEPRQETALALALREAVTNIVRHARATVCRVTLRADGHRLTFIVEDNGHGGLPREGNGLSGMRTRLREAGGTLDVDGGRGLRLTIVLPIRQPEGALARS